MKPFRNTREIPPRPSSAPRKIAILLPNLEGGGAERVSITLATAFRARGYQVDFVLAQARGELLKTCPDEIAIVDLNASKLRDVTKPLARYLRRNRPHVLLAMMWPLTCIAVTSRILAGVRLKLMLVDHTTLSAVVPRSRTQALIEWLTISLAYPLANVRVAVSKGVADDLSRISLLARSMFEVVYNPVDLTFLQQPQTCASSVLWGAKPGRRILAIGNLKPAKDFPTLLRGFKSILEREDATLRLLGDGPERAKLESLGEELGIADRMSLPGYVPDPRPYLQTADLFVLSSSREGFALVLVEALASRLPIVSTDCPSGPREILSGATLGRLVPVGDPIALGSAMIEAIRNPFNPNPGLDRARQFDIGEVAERYLSLLDLGDP